MKKIIQSYIKLKSKFKPKNDFEFENANYNRLSLINRALNKYDQKKCKYLEIGLGDCNNYNSVSLDINNKYGVPLSLFNLKQNDEFGILEVGMDKKGEIDYLSKIIKPDVGVITNINYAHAKNFKNIKQIALAKSEIINNIKNLRFHNLSLGHG